MEWYSCGSVDKFYLFAMVDTFLSGKGAPIAIPNMFVNKNRLILVRSIQIGSHGIDLGKLLNFFVRLFVTVRPCVWSKRQKLYILKSIKCLLETIISQHCKLHMGYMMMEFIIGISVSVIKKPHMCFHNLTCWCWYCLTLVRISLLK